MSGRVRFELGHRLLAQFVGLLTIILAFWMARVDRRPWMRKLGWTALATVIAQGVLGGIAVLRQLPPVVSAAHATLAQTFFCLVTAIWLFSGRRWAQVPRLNLPSKRPSVQTLTMLALAVGYVQVILGASFRHSGASLPPHIAGAAIVTFVVLWTIVRVLTDYAGVDDLRRPAVTLLALLMVQLALGFAAWATRLQWGRDSTQSGVVAATVAHVAVGALVLATTLVLAIRVWRHVAVPHGERVPAHTPKAVAV